MSKKKVRIDYLQFLKRPELDEKSLLWYFTYMDMKTEKSKRYEDKSRYAVQDEYKRIKKQITSLNEKIKIKKKLRSKVIESKKISRNISSTNSNILANNKLIQREINTTALELKIKGFSTSSIAQELIKKYKTTLRVGLSAANWAYLELAKEVDEDFIKNTVLIHSECYDDLYNKFTDLESDRSSIRALKSKELLNNIGKDIFDIQINNVFEDIEKLVSYGLDKLTKEERKIFDKIISSITQISENDNTIEIDKTKNSISINENFEFELKRYIYKKSYYEFFKDAFKILHPGEAYNDNWHIKLICDKLQEEVLRIAQKKPKTKDLIINVPFRSAKSMVTSVIFPVWTWINYPHIKFIYVSYAESLALEHAQFSKNLMLHPWFQNLFGDCFNLKADENSKEFYVNNAGGFRKSVGTGGQITGSGADILICLPAGQKLMTNKGELDIKDIVESKLDVKILSVNRETNKLEFNQINRYDKNKGKKLYKITTESGKEFICTLNHKVWTENRGYIEAQYLTLEDIILSI